MSTPTIQDLRKGDVLLYDSPSIIDWLITRTGPAAHIEIYDKDGNSLASRNGIGVNHYPFRSEGLIAILRPNGTVNYALGDTWFESVKGEGYDWKGVTLDFILDKDVEQSKHLFCSAFAALYFSACGFPLFNIKWPKGLTTPSDFFKTVRLDWFWTKDSINLG